MLDERLLKKTNSSDNIGTSSPAEQAKHKTVQTKSKAVFKKREDETFETMEKKTIKSDMTLALDSLSKEPQLPGQRTENLLKKMIQD